VRGGWNQLSGHAVRGTSPSAAGDAA